MTTQGKSGYWIAVSAACLLASVFSSTAAMAGGNAGSRDFTITAIYDTWGGWGTGGNAPSFSVTGAIRDKGTWWQSGSLQDETGITWRLYTFSGSGGEFYLGWLPKDPLDEGVEYPVTIYPGTGDYTNISGVALVSARIRDRYIWYETTWGSRIRYTYWVVTWTINGTLNP